MEIELDQMLEKPSTTDQNAKIREEKFRVAGNLEREFRKAISDFENIVKDDGHIYTQRKI